MKEHQRRRSWKEAWLMVIQEVYERKKEVHVEVARKVSRDYQGQCPRANHQSLPICEQDGQEVYDHGQWQERSHPHLIDFPGSIIWIEDPVYHHRRRCIQWIGETILYQQIRFSMAEIRTIFVGGRGYIRRPQALISSTSYLRGA